MNIGVDVRVLTDEKLTGVGYFTLAGLKAIVDRDKENHYYLFSSGLKTRGEHWKKIQGDNVHVVQIPVANKLMNLKFFTKVGDSFFKKFPAKLDLFWLPNLNFYHFDKNVPTILTIHDLSFFHKTQFYSLRRVIWHKLVNLRQLAENSAKIVTVSKNTRRDVMRSFSLDPRKVIHVYPGVEMENVHNEDSRKLLQEMGVEGKYFLYLGTIEPRKNIKSIIKAFDKFHAQHTEYSLVMVGGKGWLYNDLIREIDKRDYIKYFGYLQGRKKAALYKNAQALLWPSFYEGFGFPPLEAAMYKTPSIISYKTSLPETMQQCALYVDPYNVSDLHRALESIAFDEQLQSKMQVSLEQFKVPNWNDFAIEMLQIFRQVKNENSN